MTTIKSILKEMNERLFTIQQDMHQVRAFAEVFMKAMMTEGASFPVIITKDETKVDEKKAKSSYVKVTPEMELIIAEDLKNGMSERAIAKKLNIGKTTVNTHKPHNTPLPYTPIQYNKDFNLKYIRINQIAQSAGKHNWEIENACNKLGYQIYVFEERSGGLAKAILRGLKFPLLSSDFWKDVEKEAKRVRRCGKSDYLFTDKNNETQ